MGPSGHTCGDLWGAAWSTRISRGPSNLCSTAPRKVQWHHAASSVAMLRTAQMSQPWQCFGHVVKSRYSCIHVASTYSLYSLHTKIVVADKTIADPCSEQGEFMQVCACGDSSHGESGSQCSSALCILCAPCVAHKGTPAGSGSETHEAGFATSFGGFGGFGGFPGCRAMPKAGGSHLSMPLERSTFWHRALPQGRRCKIGKVLRSMISLLVLCHLVRCRIKQELKVCMKQAARLEQMHDDLDKAVL